MEKSICSDEYKRLLELLREFRDEKDLTQRQVAERLGQPQSWVSKVETGQRRIDVTELGQILTALGVPKGQLLRRLDPSWLDTGEDTDTGENLDTGKDTDTGEETDAS